MRSSYSKILITGAAGFIASHTANLLLKLGHEVIGLDNLNDSCHVRLKKYRLKQLSSSSSFYFYKTDVEDARSLKDIFRRHKPQAVIHLAARAGVRYSLENPSIYVSTNVMGTLNVLECCREQGISKLVFASTSSLYASERSPFREDSPVNTPISPYAATKKSAETMCYTYHHLHGIDVTILRYFTVYGPAGRPDMSYFRFIEQIMNGKPILVYGDGSQKRDFTYVEDIARGTVLGLKKVGFRVINLGGGECHKLSRLIKLVEKYSGKKASIRYLPEHKTDMKFTRADTTRANKILNWKAQVSLEEGVRRIVEWHQKNRSLVEKIPLL